MEASSDGGLFHLGQYCDVAFCRFHRQQVVNRQGQGFWLDILLGIIGAFVGGYLFSFFGKEGVTGLNLYSMLVAVAGSVVVLLIYNLVRRSV